VAVFLGNGDGTFQTARYFGVGSDPHGITVGDVNRDGSLDLVVTNRANPFAPGTVSVLLGNGDGTFQPARYFLVGDDPRWAVIGDFNQDGSPDLAVVNNVTGDVTVLLGNGDGDFRTAQTISVGGRPGSLRIGDFNGDNQEDLAVSNEAFDD